MKELENFLNALDIDNDYHNKIFECEEFEKIYTKINLNQLRKIKRQIYWLSLLIYRICTVNYVENINDNVNVEKQNIKLERDSFIIFHPIGNVSSELCKQFKNNFIYPSLISSLCRQIIEQICLIQEIENSNIDERKIIEASIESYNKQIGAKTLNIEYLNSNNKGLLKIFNNKTTYGKLANKWDYGFMYNFFSGDIHTISQIDKLIPFSKSYTFYEIYLKCVLALLKECLIEVNKYNKYSEIDLDKLNSIEFINIKGNKK